MKKHLLYILLMFSGMNIYAQGVDSVTLVMSGIGVTKQEATHAALRNAIEQAYGVFVSANTEILNDSLVRDEIITIASGNVYSYHELGASVLPNGNHEVMLQATLSAKKMVTYAQSKGAVCELVGGANYASSITANLQLIRLNQMNTRIAFEHLKKQLLQVAAHSEMVAFKLHVEEPELEDPNAEELYCIVPIRIEAYWGQGALQFVELMSNTLNALRLTSEQIEQLKHYKIPYYSAIYNTLKTTIDGGKEVGVTSGNFYAEIDFTDFLTPMMNSLLNPYYVVNNLNDKWGVNVAYTRRHNVLFQDQMLSWDASQLTQPYLGLITQREWRLRIRLEELAKVTNFEIVKYNPSQYKDIRITVPAKSLRATKLSDGTYAPSGDNYWLLQNEFGTFGHVRLHISEGWNYMPCVDMSIYIDDVFQHSGVIQVVVPVAYETLKKYHQFHQNISMKALSSTSTLMTFNPYAIIHSGISGGIYNTREDPQFSIILVLNTLFPEWNGILLE